MKAFALDELGKPGTVRDLEVPEPAEGQVQVRVAAAGLNPFDTAVMQGYLEGRMQHRFPLVPGLDAYGTVEALGEGFDAWKIGDDVFGAVGKMYMGEGTVAEFATMSAGTVARRPSSMDHSLAAAIPTAGVTALMMADALKLAQGDVVVAVGATGGVGSFFTQLASARGARVVAICSGQKADYAHRLGAAEVIDYMKGDVAAGVRSIQPGGIDAIAVMHGDAQSISGLVDQLRPGGRVVSAVGSADVEALAGRGFEGTNVNGMVATAALDELAGMLERKGLLAPDIHAFSLKDAAEAYAEVATGHVRGKVVVTTV